MTVGMGLEAIASVKIEGGSGQVAKLDFRSRYWTKTAIRLVFTSVKVQNAGKSMPEAPTATSVERALSILECLDSSSRGLNISEISRKLGIPKSSAHVIILTLEKLGYVQKQERFAQLQPRVEGLWAWA